MKFCKSNPFESPAVGVHGNHSCQVRVRKYHDSDLDAVLHIWENASRLAHPFLPDDYFEQERESIPRQHLPKANTWVAETGGEVIGFISLLGNEVGALFVQPGYHGKGAGRALMDKASELHEMLEVEVFANNSIGRRFYTTYGFAKIGSKLHPATGQLLLRLEFTAGNNPPGRCSRLAGR